MNRTGAWLAWGMLVACSRPGGDRPPPRSDPPPPAAAPVAVGAAGDAAPATLPAADPLGPFYARALEGDLRDALPALEAAPAGPLGEAPRAARTCLLDRFRRGVVPAPAKDPWLERVLGVYRRYWSGALLGAAPPAEGERRLAAELEPLLPAGPGDAGWDDRLGTALAAHGLHGIRGVTAPYRDLLVWRAETRASYDVPLPDGPRRVEVVLMRDFASLGWEGWATCEQHYPGGWAEKDRLFCMADAYDLDSEDFRVSYLAHETQHFADYERFPNLAGPELEYRAKLVELVASRATTRALVERFAERAGPRRASPHAYASGKVTAGLARELGGPPAAASPERIRAAARALLDQSTRTLAALGPDAGEYL